MQFIGQSKIIVELNGILPLAKSGASFNILLEARSGYGKTFLGLQMVKRVAPWQIFSTEDAQKIVYSIESMKTRANLIDEVSYIKNLELFYPMMDAQQYFLVFATNQDYGLPEAFRRRCIQLIFSRYNMNELSQIAQGNMQDFNISRDCLEYVVKSANYTPGNVVLLCWRLRTHFHNHPDINLNELTDVITNIFDIKDGLDIRCREYLEILERLGTASMETMAYTLNLPRDTIKKEIEGILLEKNLITISSKGRSLKK